MHLDDLDDVAHGPVEAVQTRGDEEGGAAQPRRPPAEVDPGCQFNRIKKSPKTGLKTGLKIAQDSN